MILDQIKEENDPDFYKKRFEEASNYCMRMIEATHDGFYTTPIDPLSKVGYLDVVSDDCADKIRFNTRLLKVLIPIVVVETSVLVLLFFKYIY